MMFHVQGEEAHHLQSQNRNNMLVKLIKYYPIIMNFSILFIMIGWIFNFKAIQIYTFIGQSFYLNLIVLILSYKFRFCLWHRILIYSMSFVLLLETLSLYGIYLNYYLYICSCILVFSLLTAAILYYKYGCFNKRTVKNTQEHSKMDR